MAARLGRCPSPLFMNMSTVLIVLFKIMSLVCAQSPISTTLPVPPLQWLNLNSLTGGSPPPPLKDSSIGYDENTRTLIVFGGESQGGVPQQGTYLLDMDSLSWSTPSTKVSTQVSNPPARSRALGTGDFAANSRRDFVIFGGKGGSNDALNDVWTYDFLNQFWVSVTLSGSPQPAPRWGTFGGIDPAVVPGSGNNVSTTFWIAGGSDDTRSFPSSDLWQLVITGTLASDVTAVVGLWQNKSLASALPGKTEAGGGLVSAHQASNAHVVISGGCASTVLTLNANASCADPSTFVLTVPSDSSPGSSISPAQCPAPRLGPAIVPNLNPSSTAFVSQSFMILGTFDSSQWNDDGGLNKGEVAVLDADTGTWARVLPAGDPGPSAGTPTFPSPRQGAAALSFPSALVGGDRQSSSDIIVFGGQDARGNYLNELWLLRAYNASIAGSGTLGTGTGASGAGVSVQYLSQCAQQLKPTATSSSSSLPSATRSSTAPATNQSGHTAAPMSTPIVATFDASTLHKTLSPVSIALALAATVITRLCSPAASQSPAQPDRRLALICIAIPVGVASYAVGVAGFATSLTSTTRSSPNLQRRDVSTATFLTTAHGQAGFALFLGFYCAVPLFALCLWLAKRKGRPSSKSSIDDDTNRKESEDIGAITGEKDLPNTRRVTSPTQSVPDIHSNESSVRDRRQRAQSGPGLFPGWKGREMSENSEPGPATPSKGFEVTNRPRRASGGMVLYPPRDQSHRPRTEMARSLSDISWLERRRSVSAVGELDYALSQLGHGASPLSVSPPPTSRPPTVAMSNRPFVRTPPPQPLSTVALDGWDVALHTLFHAFLLANCIISLIALFSRAPIATFAVFLIWTLAAYIALLLLAWNGKPRRSILVNVVTSFRAPSSQVVASPTSEVPGSPTDEHGGSPFFQAQTPPPGGSPYIYHQPPWRRAVSPEEDRATWTSHGGRHTVETDEPEDDEDDDDRQRHMEEELMRRDVNIVTVPRRKLWITNPGV